MSQTRIITPPVLAAEPVELALLAGQVRADIDASLVLAYETDPRAMPAGADPALWIELKLLHLKLRAARKKVEAYTQRLFAAQQVAITYELNEPYELPAGAQAVSVSGFFSTLTELAAYRPEEYRKGITISRDYPLSLAASQTYTVIADAVADVEWVDLASEAILEIAAEWYKNRETSVSGVANVDELPISWRVKLAEARRVVLGES